MKKFFGWMLILFAVGVAVTGFLLLSTNALGGGHSGDAVNNDSKKANEPQPKPGSNGRPWNFEKKRSDNTDEQTRSNGHGGATEANAGKLDDEIITVIKTQAEQGKN